MKRRISVDQHAVTDNALHDTNKPTIRVDDGDGEVRVVHGVYVICSCGEQVAEVKYHSKNRLADNARVWVETDQKVVEY